MSYNPQVNGVISVIDIKLNGINLSSAINGSDGSRKVGDFNNYSNFTPSAATVKGALLGIDSALFGYLKTDLSNISGTLTIAHGGTGQTTASAAFGSLSPLQIKGDLLAYGTSNARFPIGSDGQILTADSTQTLGLRWITVAPPSGGTVTSVAASVPSYMTISGSPITTSGTLAFDFASQAQNKFFSSPAGSSGVPGFRVISPSDVPTLNQNTTGTASNVTGTVAIANGGTGQVTQQAAINALVGGAGSAGFFLRSDGFNVAMSAIQSADLPTVSLSNVVGILSITHGGTGQNNAAAAFAALSPLTTAGDIIYEDSSPAPARLGIGSEGQLLTVSSGLPVWMTPATSGTVTNVATGTGLTGGPITSTGTISLASIADGNILSNISGSSAAPVPNTLSSIIDYVFGSSQGDILYRGASSWVVLSPGSAGKFLQTGGPSANPQWTTVSVPVTSVNGSTGAVVVNAINQLTSDVTAGPATQSQSVAATVAAIQGTTVSGTTGTGNVVFSASPTLTGTLIASAISASGSISASNFSGSSSGTNTGDQTITLTSDVTGSGTGSFATTVAKIQGTTVSGTTGTGRVVFDTAPTFAGNVAMGSNKITGLASGTASGDALQWGQIGVANGIAGLDGGGKVPYSQLPSALMTFKGAWDASTNTPTLADGIGLTGDTYRASVAGTQNLGSGSQTWAIGDFAIYNGTIWQHSPAADGVASVNGNTGAVTVNAINQLTGDVTAGPASGSASAAATVAKIQGTTVSGTTGSGNVVFSVSPTVTGTLNAAAISASGSLSASNFSGSSSGTNTGDQTITLTGDVTGSGTGSFATTLATVNSNVGSFGSSTAITTVTVNAKGLITAISENAVIAPAGTLSGTTLNSTVVSSSLTSVGTIATGVWNGTAITETHGGTNQTSYATGDILYASASNTLSKLPIGANGTILQVATNIPSWVSTSSLGVSTSTASTLVARDANINFATNSIAQGVRTQTTVNSTLALLVGDAPTQQFTGTTAGQIVTLPDATTLRNGTSYSIRNRSTQTITVNANGGGLLSTVSAGVELSFILISNGTSAGTWDFTAGGFANTVLSNLGTTSINSDMLPSASLTRNFGSTALPWSTLFIQNIQAPDTNSAVNMAIRGSNVTGGNATGGNISITGGIGQSAGSGGTVSIVGGSLGGNLSGSNGSVILQVLSAGGSAGKIKFQNGSEGTPGAFWVSSDNAGSGGWVNSPILNGATLRTLQYNTGTASQSGTTVTGSGTTFTAAMVGSTLIYANGVSAGFITAFTSTTQISVSTSQTVTSQAFSIYLNALINQGVATPGKPAGTAVGSGGTIGAGSNFAKIVAIDKNGLNTAASIESSLVTTVANDSINWTWDAIQGAISYQIWVSQSTGTEARFFTSGTNSFTQTQPASSGTAGTIPTLNITSPALYNGLQVIGTAFTTGNLVSLVGNSFTTGNLLSVSSTTNSSSGSLLNLNLSNNQNNSTCLAINNSSQNGGGGTGISITMANAAGAAISGTVTGGSVLSFTSTVNFPGFLGPMVSVNHSGTSSNSGNRIVSFVNSSSGTNIATTLYVENGGNQPCIQAQSDGVSNSAFTIQILSQGAGSTGIGQDIQMGSTNSSTGVRDAMRLYAATTNLLAGNGTAIKFTAGRTTGGVTDIARVSGLITDIGNTTYKGALTFQTSNSGAAPVEKMRISDTGVILYGATASSLASSLMSTPAAPTGSIQAAGGTLTTGTYFAKIVALDANGYFTAAGAESTVVNIASGTTNQITWTWTAIAGAASYQIWVSQTTGTEAQFFTSTDVSFIQTTTTGTAGTIPTVSSQGIVSSTWVARGTTTTATAAGTTTLVAGSTANQQFTGSTTQTVVLPNATTLPVGTEYNIMNRSTGTVTIQTNGGATLQTSGGGTAYRFILINNGTSAGTWDTSGIGTVPLNAITGATGSSSIENGANTVTMNWNNLSSGSGITLTGNLNGGSSASYMTFQHGATNNTSTLLNLSQTSNSGGVALKINQGGASGDGVVMTSTTNTSGKALNVQALAGSGASSGGSGNWNQFINQRSGWTNIFSIDGSASGGDGSNSVLEVKSNHNTVIKATVNNTSGGAATGSAISLNVPSNGVGSTSLLMDGTIVTVSGGSNTRDAISLTNSATATANTGLAIYFNANRTTGGNTRVVDIGALITDIGNATYKGAFFVKTSSSGATPTEKFRVTDTGVTVTGTEGWNGSTSGTLTHQAAATTTSYTLTWPAAQGAAGTTPVNDGSGNLNWVSVGNSPAAETNLGTLTWTSVIDPSGTISKTYRYIQVGKQVTFWAKVTASVAGTNVSQLSFPLPAGVPTPSIWGTQESSGLVVPGTGALQDSLTTNSFADQAKTALFDDGAGGYNIVITLAASLSGNSAWAQLTWITA